MNHASTWSTSENLMKGLLTVLLLAAVILGIFGPIGYARAGEAKKDADRNNRTLTSAVNAESQQRQALITALQKVPGDNAFYADTSQTSNVGASEILAYFNGGSLPDNQEAITALATFENTPCVRKLDFTDDAETDKTDKTVLQLNDVSRPHTITGIVQVEVETFRSSFTDTSDSSTSHKPSPALTLAQLNAACQVEVYNVTTKLKVAAKFLNVDGSSRGSLFTANSVNNILNPSDNTNKVDGSYLDANTDLRTNRATCAFNIAAATYLESTQLAVRVRIAASGNLVPSTFNQARISSNGLFDGTKVKVPVFIINATVPIPSLTA